MPLTTGEREDLGNPWYLCVHCASWWCRWSWHFCSKTPVVLGNSLQQWRARRNRCFRRLLWYMYLLLANLLLTYWDRLFFHRWNVHVFWLSVWLIVSFDSSFLSKNIIFYNYSIINIRMISWFWFYFKAYQSVKCDKLRTLSNNPLYKYTRC